MLDLSPLKFPLQSVSPFDGSVSSVDEIVVALVGRDGCEQASGSPGRLSDTQKGDNMKFAHAASLALIGCLVGFNSASAQGAASGELGSGPVRHERRGRFSFKASLRASGRLAAEPNQSGKVRVRHFSGANYLRHGTVRGFA